MNVTVVFLKPSLGITLVEATYEAGNLADGRSDIVIGTMPLLSIFLSLWFQPTIL